MLKNNTILYPEIQNKNNYMIKLLLMGGRFNCYWVVWLRDDLGRLKPIEGLGEGQQQFSDYQVMSETCLRKVR